MARITARTEREPFIKRRLLTARSTWHRSGRQRFNSRPLKSFEVRMKRLLRSTSIFAVTLLALALATPSLAQGQEAVVTGRVISDQGQPLAGANVFIPELNISVATNQSGAFSITVPAARVRGQPAVLRARAIGYQPGTNPIALNPGSQTFDFSRKQDLTALSAVVVTGVT